MLHDGNIHGQDGLPWGGGEWGHSVGDRKPILWRCGHHQRRKIIDEKIEEVLANFLKVVKTAAQRLVTTKFALCQPIRRPRDKWYSARLQDIVKRFCDGIGEIGLENVSWGGFHKSWAHGVKRRAHPNLGENAISWAQGANAWCQLRVNSCKKDGRRA